MSEKERKVEATLSVQLYQEFLKVKEHYGLKSNANVLRYLISKEYHEIIRDGKVPIPFTETDYNRIVEWADKAGKSTQEFVNESLVELMKSKGIL